MSINLKVGNIGVKFRQGASSTFSHFILTVWALAKFTYR